MCFPKTSLSVPGSEERAACGWCFQELAGHWADLVHALPSGYLLYPLWVMQSSWGWQGTRLHHPGAHGALCLSQCSCLLSGGVDNSLLFLTELLAEAVVLHLLLLKNFVRLEHLAGETGTLSLREAEGFGFLSRY